MVTDLVLEEPDVASGGISKRTLAWTIATLVILVLALGGALFALRSARNLQKERPKKAAPSQSVSFKAPPGAWELALK